MKENTNLGKFLSLYDNEFKTEYFPIQILLVWGLEEQDLGKCHRTDVKCNGDTVWDQSFNLNSPEAQRDLLVNISNVK